MNQSTNQNQTPALYFGLSFFLFLKKNSPEELSFIIMQAYCIPHTPH